MKWLRFIAARSYEEREAIAEGDEMFMAPQTFPGRVGGPQDQFRIGQKLNAF